MSNSTTNIGLTLPTENEYYDIKIVNENTRKIDEAIGQRPTNESVEAELAKKADKSTTYTKAETDLTRTYTLKHSKSGAVHTLTGLPTTNGIYQCQFVAVAEYAEGETFADGYTAKPNGEEATLPNKAFVTGDLVNVVVDTERKKLGFKLGGGGGYGTLSPQIRNFTAKAGNHEITLNWANPSDSNFAGLYLVRKQGSAPQKLSDGIKIDVGKATSYTDREPENDKLYYYRAFTYNQKKQVQTELTGAVVNATPKAFSLPKFTGQHSIFGNEEKGRIEMYSSGTLTLSEANYDLFAVGGGGGGGGAGQLWKSADTICAGAGGGGYTENRKGFFLGQLCDINVQIGSGGSGGYGRERGGYYENGYGEHGRRGSTTELTVPSILNFTAGGGYGGDGGGNNADERKGDSGGNGGSGGGSAGGWDGRKYTMIGSSGATDGRDADDSEYPGGGKPSSGYKGGTGQGETTRAFGETNGVLYSSGGNAKFTRERVEGGGGSAGCEPRRKGGFYFYENEERDGSINTGGGGGALCFSDTSKGHRGGNGGSGIAIIRWGY